MFNEWGFLLGEIWVLLALAALVGLIAGWIIWGRRSEVNVAAGSATNSATNSAVTVDTGEADGLRADLGKCREAGRLHNDQIAKLEADLAACQAAKVAVAAPAAAAVNMDFDGDGVVEGENEGVKPTTLDAPRDGKADDLKKVKGIGPKMEKLCNKLGFWHFDQIANWSTAEVAWVDANLEGFKGRVSRDTWVAQAKLLAAGKETEFSKKVGKGGVY